MIFSYVRRENCQRGFAEPLSPDRKLVWDVCVRGGERRRSRGGLPALGPTKSFSNHLKTIYPSLQSSRRFTGLGVFFFFSFWGKIHVIHVTRSVIALQTFFYEPSQTIISELRVTNIQSDININYFSKLSEPIGESVMLHDVFTRKIKLKHHI